VRATVALTDTIPERNLTMLANLSKTAIETAIAAAIERAKSRGSVDSVTVKWSNDRAGCRIATLRADRSISVIVEEQDENEWTAYLDGTLPAFSIGSLTPRLETPEEVDDAIALLRRGRTLLSSVQVEIERAVEIGRAAR
jgi:hypothetical protein